MKAMDANEFIKDMTAVSAIVPISLITSIVGSGAVSGLILYLARNWIGERIRQWIQHEYDIKLEAFKAELNARSQVAIEKLRSVQSLAAASFVEGRKAAQERHLEALQYGFTSCPGPPTPVESKALPMPLDHGGRLRYHHHLEATRPHPVEPDPQEPIDGAEPQTAGPLAIQDRDLMTKRGEL